MGAYEQLEKRFRQASLLQEIDELLYWDAAVLMPAGAAAGRADQQALTRVLEHEARTAPEVEELLAQAEQEVERLDPWQRANLREMRRSWIHAAAVPKDLVDALSRATSAGEHGWRSARPRSDLETTLPLLEEVLRLVRESATAKAAELGCTPYDALLDEHEPGRRVSQVDELFDELATFLPELLGQVLEAQQAGPELLLLGGAFPVARQRTLARRLMEQLGFEFDHGRLDESAHPFCGGTPDDVRITTRYDTGDFTESLMATLHETGHGLYQRGLPQPWRSQPVGQARGAGIHESQSLLVEMQACRSRGFVEFVAPLLRQAFEVRGPAWEADNLYRHYTRVKPGLIRVTADEVTYPAHVILRYRLERAMLAGDLTVRELPAAWNEGMQELLGITPSDHAQGCLQDVHWFVGAWGYFPSYTLGAITAAQLFRAALANDAAIQPGIAAGDFGPLLGWLRDKVHRWGSFYETDELIDQATGTALDLAHFKRHLTTRYLAG